jgi:hypothetical protein
VSVRICSVLIRRCSISSSFMEEKKKRINLMLIGVEAVPPWHYFHIRRYIRNKQHGSGRLVRRAVVHFSVRTEIYHDPFGTSLYQCYCVYDLLLLYRIC